MLGERELGAREAVLAAERDVERGVEGAAAAAARARAAHGAAAEALRKAYPRLWRMFVVSPPSLASVRALVPKDAVVVSYFVAARATTALVVRAGGVSAVRLPVERRTLEDAVRRLRAGLQAFAPVDDILAALGRELLDPVLPGGLEGARTLVVVPHGPLFHVPFAAVPLAGAPLIDQAAVSLAPSSTLLFDRLSEPRLDAPASVAAVAPASDLPFARLEALAVGGAGTALGPEATETRVRALRADALDLAAHVELDAADPLSSAVVLARDPESDGRLEVREVFGLRALPPVVTLSACSSAGSELHGDEWVGLGHAFLTAGSRTVVATQGRVSDLAAAVLTKRFYRALGKRPAAEALREAAQWTRRYYPHPAHWATFVLIGDFR